MYRTLGALLGLAVIGAVFAAVYYGDGERLVEDRPPAFNLAPGERRPDFLEPSVPGGEITVEITVTGAPVDIWVMDQEWLTSTIDAEIGGFNLSRPFSYHAEYSALNVTGVHNFTLVADGKTRLAMVFDHAGSYYSDAVLEDDAGTASIRVATRYLEEESKSIVLGYIAVVPSVVLIVATLGRQVQRWRLHRRERREA